MRKEFIQPVGSDLDYAALPVGEIKSVYINNPSGSWLQLFPSYDFIAPYTLGYARNFEETVQNISVKFVEGPAGQVSTEQGDALTIILYDYPISPSAGSPFVGTTSETLGATFSGRSKVSTGLTGIIVPAIANSRIRVLTISIVLGGFPSSPIGAQKSGMAWAIYDVTTAAFLGGKVTPIAPHAFLPFPNGLDFPINEPVRYTTGPDFADVDFGLTVLYRVI